MTAQVLQFSARSTNAPESAVDATVLPLNPTGRRSTATAHPSVPSAFVRDGTYVGTEHQYGPEAAARLLMRIIKINPALIAAEIDKLGRNATFEVVRFFDDVIEDLGDPDPGDV